MESVLGIILARGGSKGIPGKNMALLGGKPLVSWISATALSLAQRDGFDLIVSTDSEEIREFVTELGLWAPFLRPKELAEDLIPSLPAVQHALLEAERCQSKTYDVVVYLQPTAPFCSPEDIRNCIQLLRERPNAESAVAVAEVQTHPFRMKRLLEDGRLLNYIDQGFEDMRPRQVLTKVYRRAGSVYASRRFVVMEKGTLVGDPCFGVVVPPARAVDVDSPIDLQLANVMRAIELGEVS